MAIDRETFFEVMTAFPTGVAVVTTVDGEGRPWGMTSNAVSSVSADPPMLLVCVDKRSRTLPALLERQGFLVNFMGAGSDAACAVFASKTDPVEKFATVEWELSAKKHPRLKQAIAFVDCATELEVNAGTHLIIVGRVLDGAVIRPDRQPLAYFRRAYRDWPAEPCSR